jgi:hypothetical protein
VLPGVGACSCPPCGACLCGAGFLWGRCFGTWLTKRCRLSGLASLGLPSSPGRYGSSVLPFAGATRPCVGRARTSRCGPQAGPQCAGLPGPRPRWFRPVMSPVYGFWVLLRLRFALRDLALCRVCEVAPSFASSWRASSSASLCKIYITQTHE